MEGGGVRNTRLMQALKNIVDDVTALKNYYVPEFKPTVYLVDVDWLAKRLEKLPNWDWSKWMPLDGKYYAVSLNDWIRIIKWDRTNRHKYIVDRFDCDKYSTYFKSNVAWYFGVNTVAVVIDYDSGHSYNLVFPYDYNDAMIYEPQTDQLIQVEYRLTQFYALGKRYYVLI